MNVSAPRLLSLFILFAASLATATAQQDPRVGLKAGLRDAGQAARHMELVSSLPKPEGFYDPKQPAGMPTPLERVPGTVTDNPAAPRPPVPAANINFANTDLAFRDTQLFIGSYHGFTAYDIENARRPRPLVSVVCPGGQGDVSVHGDLLFMSVEQTRGRVDCGTQGVRPPVSAERFRGIRIFDISDVRKPKQIAAIQTCRGSHTHTLVRNPKDPATLYIYGSGTATVRSPAELTDCSAIDPDDDVNSALASIDVIAVPLAAPERARLVARPRIFADAASGAIAGLWPGGSHGPGTQTTRATDQCHDITVFPEVGLAAGACSGNGLLIDISDPVNPKRLDYVADKNFAYWHSATFNSDGTKVIFTDEWGGGTRPRCRATDLPHWGANAIFDIVDGKLRFASYYKMPAPQTDSENCVAHNGSLVPVPGRDIMVQSWYQGGISVFDFTDSTKPVEIAFFDRGPLDAKTLITGGYWSSYWFNGFIYGSEIARGLDVFRLLPSPHLTQNEIDAAMTVRVEELNAQQQERFTWPAAAVVGRAYLDQLARTKAITPARVSAVRGALDRQDAARRETVATQLDADAAAATGRDAVRLQALAATLRGRATR